MIPKILVVTLFLIISLAHRSQPAPSSSSSSSSSLSSSSSTSSSSTTESPLPSPSLSSEPNVRQQVFSSTSSFIIHDAASSGEQHQQPVAMAQTSEQPQPDIKWISSSDFLELVRYLFEQAKNIPYTNYLIIDTRNSNEYNGWKSFDAIYAALDFNRTGLQPLYDMKNGHVVDAHNFDADWLHLFDPDALKSVVTERIGIRLKQTVQDAELVPILPVVLYDTKRARLERVKQYLVDNFAVNLVYLCHLDDHELSEMVLRANISGNLFFQEPFYDMLLSPEVLNAILRPYNHSNRILLKPIADYKLFDVSSTPPDTHYDRSHIPTAVHLNTNDVEGPDHKRKSKEELARLLLDYDIKPNNTEMIILYGNPDPMAAFRAALIWKSMGVKDVRVLNGGIRAWLSKSLPIEVSQGGSTTISLSKKRGSATKDASPEETKRRQGEEELLIRQYVDQSLYAQNPINYLVDQNYVLDLVKNYDLFADQYALVDVRSYDEHVGRLSGYEQLPTRGRIPTSLWGRGGSSRDQLEDYRNPDLTMRSGVELLKMWEQLGIDYKFKHLVFYCGNGWRASEVMFYAELMGLYRISMYDGGWWDWTSNGNNSIALGPTSLNMTLEFVEPPLAGAAGVNDQELKVAHAMSTSSSEPLTTTIIETTTIVSPVGTSSSNSQTSSVKATTKSLKEKQQVSHQASSSSSSASSSISHDPTKQSTKIHQQTHHSSQSVNSSDFYYKNNQFDLYTSTVSHSFAVRSTNNTPLSCFALVLFSNLFFVILSTLIF